MPTAYVRYRSGGGYQQVEDYDYVLDYRKLMENGYYRDSGFNPIIAPEESTTVTPAADGAAAFSVGTGSSGQYVNGTIFEFSSAATTAMKTRMPDEMTHTEPRQLSWYDTTLTFLADSTQSEIITNATNSSSRTLITVADALLYSGKIVSFSGPDLPSELYPNELYYATAASSATLLLQKVVGGAFVAWGDAGTPASTVITVIDKIAEFPWANILGWSNTAPTR